MTTVSNRIISIINKLIYLRILLIHRLTIRHANLKADYLFQYASTKMQLVSIQYYVYTYTCYLIIVQLYITDLIVQIEHSIVNILKVCNPSETNTDNTTELDNDKIAVVDKVSTKIGSAKVNKVSYHLHYS